MALKTAGIVALSSALAGLAGSALTAQCIKNSYKPEWDFLRYKHPYRVDGFEEPKGELSFTYYYDGWQGAFNRVAMAHVEELKRKGYTVRLREIHEWLVRFEHLDAEPLNASLLCIRFSSPHLQVSNTWKRSTVILWLSRLQIQPT